MYDSWIYIYMYISTTRPHQECQRYVINTCTKKFHRKIRRMESKVHVRVILWFPSCRTKPLVLRAQVDEFQCLGDRVTHGLKVKECCIPSYFHKQQPGNGNGNGEANYEWRISYNNGFTETETFNLGKKRERPSFLPATVGDSPAVLSAYLLNLVIAQLCRPSITVEVSFFRVLSSWDSGPLIDKHISNTCVFEHTGKCYSMAENRIPLEIDISTPETLAYWNVDGAWTWNRRFTSHPKVDRPVICSLSRGEIWSSCRCIT